MNEYAIYIRKSRADFEAEQRGEGETLARHRSTLIELAAHRGYNVSKIYEEVASGDTISSRPEMQALLAEIERGCYAGIIVMDADRLARGDTIDQGIIKQALFSTGTLVITPIKIYDPTDPSDEDFFDFRMFFARFEYKISNRRMQTGRARSAAEGNYLGSRTTYGYNRVKRKDRSGWTLEPDPEKAEIVRMMFKWYASGLSANTIADRLNSLGLKTDLGFAFVPDTVRHMLKNPTYIGTASWGRKIKKVSVINGARITKRVSNPSASIVPNAHPAIIDHDLWIQVQNIFATHTPMPKNIKLPIKNVLCGLVTCSVCGKTMQRKESNGRPDMLRCVTKNCPTTGIYISTIESTVLAALESWVAEYSAPIVESSANVSNAPQIAAIEKQIATLNRQLSTLHDLVEQGVYTVADFVRRRDDINARLHSAHNQLHEIKSTPTQCDIIRNNLPQIRHVLEAYPLTADLQLKNDLLKSVISHIVYQKTKKCNRDENPAQYLTLTIHPLLYKK